MRAPALFRGMDFDEGSALMEVSQDVDAQAGSLRSDLRYAPEHTHDPDQPSQRADFAREIADRHRAIFDAMRQLGEDNGGGMTGIATGLLPEYARRSMITELDRNQLYQLFDILAKADTEPEQLGRLVEVNDEIANDPESSEIALAVSAVALDGITQSEDISVVAKTAELWGLTLSEPLLASTFGGAGAYIAGVSASLATADAVTS